MRAQSYGGRGGRPEQHAAQRLEDGSPESHAVGRTLAAEGRPFERDLAEARDR